MDDSDFPPETTSFKCMDIYRDEPMPRKPDRLNSSNLTVECPGCSRFWFLHRNQWPSKKSGGRVSCTSCGTFVPSKEWRLRHVPWLRVVA